MNPILICQSEDGRTKLDVRLEDQTVWLNQKQLTDLFGKAKGTISEHIKHIFEDKELDEHSVVRFFRTTECSSSSLSFTRSRIALSNPTSIALSSNCRRQGRTSHETNR